MSAGTAAGPEGETLEERLSRLSAEVDALQVRLSRLGEASLRINESLEFAEVLQGVLDSARTLTGAAYALVYLVDGDGEPVEFLTSGLTAEQDGEFWEMPGAWEIFDFLSGIEVPLRLDDLQGFLRERQLPDFAVPMPVSSALAMLAAPIVHRGRRVGAVHVCERPGGFTAADEDTLVMFAAQAALVIANARLYRSERQARAHLEALLSTAPMAVVVLDARTGALRSANAGARRVMGDVDASIDALGELVSGGVFRRADGEEISPQELTLLAALATGETVRGEEMTIEFANGKKVTAVVNATPVPGADGAVDAVVVTAQDMAPPAEMTRLRAEFLGMIGHELRVPLAAIKGSAATLRKDRAPLDTAEADQYHRIIEEQADHMIEVLSGLSNVAGIDSGALPGKPRPGLPTTATHPAHPHSATSPVGPLGHPPFQLGDLTIDHPARLVTVAGRPVNLTPIEYNVLVEFAANAGRVITHQQLLTTVWGPDSPTDPGRMHTAIKNLRRKLGDHARNPRYIATVPHIGYRMAKPQPADAPTQP